MDTQYGKAIRRIVCRSVYTVLLAALIHTAGCGGFDRRPPESPPAIENESRNRSVLEEARLRFEHGDFEKASVIFEQLYNCADSPDIRENALYGLACSRLILADDGDALGEAVCLWNTWSQSGNPANHDPRMLAPLIQRIAVNGFVEPEIAYMRSEENQEEPEPPKTSVPVEPEIPVEDKPDACEIELEDREKQIRGLEKGNRRLKRRIRKLKKQIESLENIHRNIREKKKEFYYP